MLGRSVLLTEPRPPAWRGCRHRRPTCTHPRPAPRSARLDPAPAIRPQALRQISNIRLKRCKLRRTGQHPPVPPDCRPFPSSGSLAKLLVLHGPNLNLLGSIWWTAAAQAWPPDTPWNGCSPTPSMCWWRLPDQPRRLHPPRSPCAMRWRRWRCRSSRSTCPTRIPVSRSASTATSVTRQWAWYAVSVPTATATRWTRRCCACRRQRVTARAAGILLWAGLCGASVAAERGRGHRLRTGKRRLRARHVRFRSPG